MTIEASPRYESDQQCRDNVAQLVQQYGDRGQALIAQVVKFARMFSYKSVKLKPDEQEVAVQEALLSIFSKYHQINASCNGWVLTIVQNACIDQLRARKKNSSSDSEADWEETETAKLHPEHLRQVFPTQDVIDEINCIKRVLERVRQNFTGEQDIRILEMSVLGLSHEEAAQQLGRTPSAISTRLSELRKKLCQLKKELC